MDFSLRNLQTNMCGFLNNFFKGYHSFEHSILRTFSQDYKIQKTWIFFNRASHWDNRASHRTIRVTVENCSWICSVLLSHKCIIFRKTVRASIYDFLKNILLRIRHYFLKEFSQRSNTAFFWDWQDNQ